MSLKELKLIFPKISDAPSPSDRDAYFLFALAALWRDSRGEERQEWWSVLEKEERRDLLRLLGGLGLWSWPCTTRIGRVCGGLSPTHHENVLSV